MVSGSRGLGVSRSRGLCVLCVVCGIRSRGLGDPYLRDLETPRPRNHSPHHHPIPTRVLCCIQPLVCGAEERVDGTAIIGKDGRADADRQPRATLRSRHPLDAFADPFGDRGQGGMIDLRDDHRELFAAVPGREINRAQGLANHARHPLQRVIAGEVAVGIVVFLEAVEVEDEDAEALRVAAGALDLDLDALAEGAEVRQVR